MGLRSAVFASVTIAALIWVPSMPSDPTPYSPDFPVANAAADVATNAFQTRPGPEQSGRGTVNAKLAAKNLANRNVEAYFRASLNSMEQADFLLSPALLMQEAISKDVLITYPQN